MVIPLEDNIKKEPQEIFPRHGHGAFVGINRKFFNRDG